MAKYNICIRSNGKSNPLSYNFNSKSRAINQVRIQNDRINRFRIGGRGFKSQKEAFAWKLSALKHPPLGYTKEQYNIILKVEPIKINYKYEVCKN